MTREPTRQNALRAPAATPGPIAARAANTAEQRARLATRLTARDRWIIAMLHEHRVLTSDHITALAFPSFRSGRQRLRELYLWSVLDRFQPHVTTGTAPMHYVLGPAGAAILAAEHGLDVKNLRYRPERATDIAHSLRLAHTIGINTWFTRLTTRTHPGATVLAWWSETRCAAHFGDLVRPDAYGLITSHQQPFEFFLEYDAGTENPARLGDKLAGYHALAQTTAITTPVLVWLTQPGREPAARRHLTRARQALDQPHLVPVATAPHQAAASPHDRIWLPLEDGPRQRLTDLARAWPHLPPPALTSTTPHPAGQLPPVPPTPPTRPGGRP